MPNIERTVCAGCFLPVVINVDRFTLTATIPSNGLRGSNRVEARKVVEDVHYADSDADLVLWDCPRCGYADSTYADPATRKALG